MFEWCGSMYISNILHTISVFEDRSRFYLLIYSYKQVLLGQAKSGQVIIDATDPRNVVVRSITLVVDGRPNITMYLDRGKFSLFYNCCFRFPSYYVQT